MNDGPQPLPSAIGRAALSNAMLVPAQAVLSLLATAMVARTLGTSLFGTFAVFNALRASLLFCTDVGTSTAGSKFLPEVIEREGRGGAARLMGLQAAITTATGATWITALLLAAPSVTSILGIAPGHAFIVPYAAVCLAIDECGRVAYMFLWGRFAHHRVNVANVLGTAALPIFVALAIRAGGGLRLVLLAAIGAVALRTVLLWAAVAIELRRIPRRTAAEHVPNLVRRYIRVSVVSWIEKLSGYVYGASFLTLVLATFLDQAAVGQFALALEFTVRVLSLTLSPTHGIILPAVASVFPSGTRVQKQRLFTAALRTLGLWLVPAGVLLLATAPHVIPAVYSSRYLDAVLLTQILTIFYFMEYAIYAPANAVLIAGERLRAYGRIKLASLALLPAFVAAATVLPLPGIAVVYGALRLGMALALLLAASRVQQLQIPAGFYARLGSAAVLTILAGLLTSLSLGSGTVSGIAVAGVTGAAALVAYRVFGCFGREERDIFERLKLPGTGWMLRFFHV